METELISVIVPVYNVERYLRRCVDSILHQTYQDLEVLLVDDGSTKDRTPEIADEYEKNYKADTTNAYTCFGIDIVSKKR